MFYPILCGSLAGLLSALYELYDKDNFLKYSKAKMRFLLGLSTFAGGFIGWITLELLKGVDLAGTEKGIAAIAGFGGKKTVSGLQWILNLQIRKLEAK
jgi:CRISPR/Cas system endoribonuclease Cas6 (RAMP superfamily)